MSAVVADRMGGDRHNPNVELVAQGIANIASPMFGGLPATGAIARTATNIRSGARTPGRRHGARAHAAGHPRSPPRRWRATSRSPCSRAILLVVAYNMGEWHEIPRLLQADEDGHQRVARHVCADGVRRPDARGRSRHDPRRRCCSSGGWPCTTTVSQVTADYVEDGRAHSLQDKHIPPYVAIFRIHGPFLFGVTDKLAAVLDDLRHDCRRSSSSGCAT